MLKRTLCLLLTLSMLLACSACSLQELKEQAGPYMRFTDDTGAEVVLETQPQRVAVLFSSFAEVWSLAGGETTITVGESVERGFAAEDAILVDRGAGKAINTELLVDSEPDFVICSADIEAQVLAAEHLRDAGIPTAAFRMESFSDYLRILDLCTVITGDRDAYKTNGASVAARIEQLFSEISGAPAYSDILFIRAGSSASSTKAKTAEEHFAAAMLREIGTHNIAEDAPLLLDGLSTEAVIDADPDFIFIATMGDEEAAKANMDSVLSQPAWQSLRAVKNGCYVYLPKELFQFKPNANWDDAYEYLIELVYE